MAIRTCPCGSGQPREELYDARGIFCTFYCEDCEAKKRAGYRADVLEDRNYWHDEPLDDD